MFRNSIFHVLYFCCFYFRVFLSFLIFIFYIVQFLQKRRLVQIFNNVFFNVVVQIFRHTHTYNHIFIQVAAIHNIMCSFNCHHSRHGLAYTFKWINKKKARKIFCDLLIRLRIKTENFIILRVGLRMVFSFICLFS